MDKEIEIGVVRCNGDNNAKELDKKEKGTWKWTYNSTGRNLVKMWWLTKFVSAMIQKLVTEPNKDFSKICKESYIIGFGNHHGWLIRQGAGLAMNFVGSAEQVKTTFGVESFDECIDIQDNYIILRDQLEKELTKRNGVDWP